MSQNTRSQDSESTRPDRNTLHGTSGSAYFDKHQDTLTKLQAREIKNIRRETWHQEAHKLIIKRYVKTAAFPDIRRLWYREYRALKRLQPLGMPEVHGLSFRRIQEGHEILLFRDHIDGTPLENLEDISVDQLLCTMTAIYKLGVLTCDPTAENILKTPDGRLVFIDFSKGRIFYLQSPLFYHSLGKEFVRIIKLNPEASIDWGNFQNLFIQHMDLTGLSLACFQAGIRHWSRKWDLTL